MYGRRLFTFLGCASLGAALNCGGSVARSDADDSMDDGSSTEGTRSGGSQTGSASGSGQSSASGSGQSSASGSGESSASGSATVTTSGSGGSGTSGGQGGAGVTVGAGGVISVAAVNGGMVTGGPVFGGVGGMSGVAVATVTGGMIWPDDIPIPAECSVNGSSIDPYSCYMELTCDNRFAYSYCWDNGGSFLCECDNGINWNSFQLWGVDEGLACQYAASLCLAEPEPEFTESDCRPTFAEAGTGYCSSQMQCAEALTYEGIRVTRDKWHSVYCSDNMAQGARCDCQFNEGYLSFDLLETPVSAALCMDLVTGCSGDLVERKGSATCTQSFQAAGPGYCNAALDCTQDALLDGQSAVLHQQVPVNCYQNASGTWGCDCPLAGSFEVTDATAWDACVSASALCASGS